MKKLVFFLIALLVESSFGEEPAPKQRQKNSFYFDATIGTTLHHFGAEQTVRDNSGSSSGNGSYEKDIGYTGFGPLFSMRFGSLIYGGIAFFANVEFEYTTGKVYGREKGEENAEPNSFILGAGPGMLVYPFFDSEGAAKNVYMAATVNLLACNGGGIGGLGGNIVLEAGYLYPVSKRFNYGFAAGANLISPGSFDDKIKNESAFGVWAGLKLVRK